MLSFLNQTVADRYDENDNLVADFKVYHAIVVVVTSLAIIAVGIANIL